MPTRNLDIHGPVGRLEAVLMTPEQEPRAAALLCHAHPLHGGMMHFKLLYRVAKVLRRDGIAVLRFNFRGVGRSEGKHDDGRGERDDVRAALDELSSLYPKLPIVAGGYSFGSIMAYLVAAKDARPNALLIMGFPTERVENTAFAAKVRTPRLFVQGELDEFGDGAAIRNFVEELPEPRQLVVVAGADHFFTDRIDAVEAAVDEWVRTDPWGNDSPQAG